ncbi:MAG: hypothetical protein J7496_08585 [Novosphingobium sp.]|nr:hypothetical protein [Novosphingobium sp.]
MSREQSLLVPETAIGLTVSISGTSAQSAALSEDSAVVCSTVDCFVMKGTNPTATTGGAFIPANVPLRLFGWKPGQKLAFITSGATGTVYLTPGG